MRVRRFEDARSFLTEAGAFLEGQEALHNLPFAIARKCEADPGRYPGPNLFAIVEEVGDGVPSILGVVLRTPPHRLQLYVPPGRAVDAVVDELARIGHELPGVHGPAEVSSAFAERWCSPRFLRAVAFMELRCFALERVTPAPAAPGRMRVAETSDLPVVEAWHRAFETETGVTKGSLPAEEIARRAVRERRTFLWDDGGPVAQAEFVGSTTHGVRIGAVYTPSDRRRRGYATKLVEEVSRRALEEGRRFCFLFTDLANPISNSIYPKVGYVPVADFRDNDFVAG